MLEQLGGQGWGERRAVGQAIPRWRGSLGWEQLSRGAQGRRGLESGC